MLQNPPRPLSEVSRILPVIHVKFYGFDYDEPMMYDFIISQNFFLLPYLIILDGICSLLLETAKKC